MLVGTYKDKLEGSPEEVQSKIKQIDGALREELKEILHTDDRNLLRYASDDQLMFDVDNMTGGEDEVKKIRKRLEEVILHDFNELPIPASWLMFGLFLRRMGKHLMSLSNCEKIGRRLHVNDVREPIWFLHHCIGVLMYYPDVEELKDIVICDPQIVFDSVTELILNTFALNHVKKAVRDNFKQKGQFCFCEIQKLSKTLKSGILPLPQLVKLLEHRYIIARISHHASTSTDAVSSETTLPASIEAENAIYFMPTVLPSAQDSELNMTDFPQNSVDPAPLLIRFKSSIVPIGVFCACIASLVGQREQLNWILMDPTQSGYILYKDRVTFRVSISSRDYDVTLISKPKQYEVHITQYPSSTSKQPSHDICQHVLEEVCHTLDDVISKIRYKGLIFSPSNCQEKRESPYQLGFRCPLHPEADDKHVAVFTPNSRQQSQTALELLLDYSEEKTKLFCLYDNRTVNLKELLQSSSVGECQAACFYKRCSIWMGPSYYVEPSDKDIFMKMLREELKIPEKDITVLKENGFTSIDELTVEDLKVLQSDLTLGGRKKLKQYLSNPPCPASSSYDGDQVLHQTDPQQARGQEGEQPGATVAGTQQQNQLNIKNLTNALSKVQSKWRNIGIQLGVNESVPNRIENDFRGQSNRQLSEMLSYWLDGNTETQVTWETIVDALESSSVNEKGLAFEIKTRYCQSTDDTSQADLNLKNLTNALSTVQSKWHEIGVQLNIDLTKLHEFEANNHPHGCVRNLSSVLEFWLNKNTDTPVTWQTIVSVLQTPAVNENKLAGEIRSRYCQGNGSYRSQNSQEHESNVEPQEFADSKECDQAAAGRRPGTCTPSEEHHEHSLFLKTIVRGCDNVHKFSFIIKNNRTESYQLNKDGFSLSVPENSLPDGFTEVKLNVNVCASGPFELPSECDFVSAVYWIKPDPPCEFTKPLTMKLEHCAAITDDKQLSCLTFVRAHCTQPTLPYTFKEKKGGTFTSNHGVIELTSFSAYGIASTPPPQASSEEVSIAAVDVQRPGVKCGVWKFSTKFHSNQWQVRVIIARMLSFVKEIVKQPLYGQPKSEYDFDMVLAANTKTLCIPSDTIESGDWEVSPCHKPVISYSDILQYNNKDSRLPGFYLSVLWKGSGPPQGVLNKRIYFTGDYKDNFFQVIINPEVKYRFHPSVDSISAQFLRPSTHDVAVAGYIGDGNQDPPQGEQPGATAAEDQRQKLNRPNPGKPIHTTNDLCCAQPIVAIKKCTGLRPEQLREKVELILHTCNERENLAILKSLTAPTVDDHAIADKVVYDGEGFAKIGMFGDKLVAVLFTGQGELARGNLQTALETYKNVTEIVGVGVGYGNPHKEEISLGDVMVSDVIVKGSLTDKGDKYTFSNTVPVNDKLLQHARNLQNDWNNTFPVASNPDRKSKVHLGSIVSTDTLVKAAASRDKYMKTNRKAIGGEMEGWVLLGVLDQMRSKGRIIGIIVFKGVCDFGDEMKNNDWQPTAAMAAVSFVEHILTLC